MKRLLVMRHAKSDWSRGGITDHDRPLNHRGTAAARTMGRVLARLDVVPDHAITSTAVRAQTTVRLAAEAGDWGTSIEATEQLYGTSVDGALSVAAAAPSTAETVMLVGHEPTWSGLVARLTGGSVQMKTATVVGIDCYVYDWPEVLMATGELVFVLQPRMFAGEPPNDGR